jgi:hypothetical protein
MAPMAATIAWILWLAAQPPVGPVTKLPPPLAKEMTAAIVALNQMLGLESWPAPSGEPCLDRGGLEATAKDVSRDEAKRCADRALDSGFDQLGKSYVVGIVMGQIGPITVFVIGKGEAEGWGAYSCDPARKCPPTKLNGPSRQAKRLAERYRRACADKATIWLPDREGVCGPDESPPAQPPR